MGLVDNIDNKVKLKKSENREKKDIRKSMDDIDDATEAATEQLLAIGQYFWKLYMKGEYEPDEGNKMYFDNLDALNDSVGIKVAEIDNRKIEGIEERDRINEETRRKVQDKASRREERAQERARAKQFKDNERF